MNGKPIMILSPALEAIGTKAAPPPADVIALVLAGRALMDSDIAGPERRGLDQALEAFASRVCYDDEGGSLPEAHAEPCSCGEGN